VSTKRSRPFFDHDFSKSDPKDALLVASNAQSGYFDFFRDFSDHARAMHQLSLSYDKLRKNLVQNKQRLRDQIQLVFPEFLTVLDSDIDTARFLLHDYFLPRHYLGLDVDKVAAQMEAVSRQQHGKASLHKLMELAQNSVGIPVDEALETAVGLTIRSWITMLETVKRQMDMIMAQLIAWAKQTPYFEILTSLKGISEVMASFYIAETREPDAFGHYKQIEKYAGLNLRGSQSANYIGPRHISHIGNHRLSWAIYRMTEETARYTPEVRMKFLRRQLKAPQYRKNIVATSSQLLKLIVALIARNQPYEWNPDNIRALEVLEQQYNEKKARRRHAA
jgi:transposase